MTEQKKKTKLIILIIVIAAAAAAVITPLTIHFSKQAKYNEAAAYLEDEKYEEALTLFSELGDFNDSQEKAGLAQAEIDYLTIDTLKKNAEYDKISEILRTRSSYYPDSDKGREDAALAEEYDLVADAFNDIDNADYHEAAEKFASLDTLKEDFGRDLCLCRAYAAEEDHKWIDILGNLYAAQVSDYNMTFAESPANDTDKKASKAYTSGDYAALSKMIDIDHEDADRLKEVAANGFAYDEAVAQYDSGNYSKAMKQFEALGDFLDSKDYYSRAKEKYESLEGKYAEAEKLYNNQEFHKAMLAYISLGNYKDSEQKAAACVQPLPETGSYNSGNGSQTSVNIVAPGGDESVYIKIYDSGGNVAGKTFIRPGNSSTVYLLGGSYTMKVAYGTEWYGEIDLFGDNGSYQQLLNGSDTVFSLEAGADYSLQLLAGTNGNVGSRSIGGASGM